MTATAAARRLGALLGLTSALAAAAADLDLARIESTLPRQYVCQRTDTPLVVDGKLDEPAWQAAPWTDEFVDIEGADRTTPRFATRACMLWDEEFFYVGATLQEPHVWATLTARDAVIFHDNDFEVFIDPDGDTHQYYEFEMNAFSTEWDLFLVKAYRDGGPAMNAWDIQGLRTAVQVAGTINSPADVDQGWTVEIAFPWKVLRECARGLGAPPAEGDQWRVNFSRVEWQVDVVDGAYVKRPGLPEDNWVWSPQGLINMHFPEQWGIVQFTAAPAGQPAPAFVPPPGEEARRALRGIYHRQHRFREAFGHFTAVLDSLAMPLPALRYYRWPPGLYVTPHGFEAVLDEAGDADGDGKVSRWVIREDSRVWRE